MDSVDESQAKNECLYKEVRYARMTSTALPKTASFFRPNRLPLRDCQDDEDINNKGPQQCAACIKSRARERA